MSVGNLKDNGNKGNNFPFQLSLLQLLDAIKTNTSVGGGSTGYGERTSVYQATNNGAGYSIGDIIIRYDLIDVGTSTIAATIWFNQTTQSTIAAPVPGDLVPVAPPSSVTVVNGVLGAAVNVQDGGNSLTVDGTVAATQSGFWDIRDITGTISLPTGAATEVTVNDIYVNSLSKIGRIKGAPDYSRAFAYDVNQNVDTITHTGTTLLGVETIIETFTYDVNQNVTSIVYS